MPEATSHLVTELPIDRLTRAATLSHNQWPGDPQNTPADKAKLWIKQARAYNGPAEHAHMIHIVEQDDQTLANARSFARTIRSQQGDLTILALASVVTSPDHRGKGLGKAVVQAAFDRVEQGHFAFCLFQTTPENQGFYEKLGAAIIDNPTMNSVSDEPAFWDELAVLYPASKLGIWPPGTIDLLGPGY